MPKEKPFEANIENFYKKKTIDIMMFAWVSCLEKNLPGVNQTKAIENFLAYWGLNEDDYPFDSAKVIYSQIKQDFLWSGIKYKIPPFEKINIDKPKRSLFNRIKQLLKKYFNFYLVLI